uniref:Uncharacterized protein n=1 Tax=Anguilla anguilla TaxID=7936 RepID=A0A0E9XJJ0_ANGAN
MLVRAGTQRTLLHLLQKAG